MPVSPARSIFLESVSTGQQAHDHQRMADDIARVIHLHTNTAFAVAVTGNTRTNKKAWKILSEEFPSCYFQACTSYACLLLVKDVCNNTINGTASTGFRFTTPVVKTAVEPMLVWLNKYGPDIRSALNMLALVVKQQLTWWREASGTRYTAIKSTHLGFVFLAELRRMIEQDRGTFQDSLDQVEEAGERRLARLHTPSPCILTLVLDPRAATSAQEAAGLKDHVRLISTTRYEYAGVSNLPAHEQYAPTEIRADRGRLTRINNKLHRMGDNRWARRVHWCGI